MQDRLRWNEKYSRLRPFDVNETLVKYAQLLRPGLALDLAGGTGQNARFLAGLGSRTVVADVSDVGLQRADGMRVLAASPALPFASGVFDSIICINFLDVQLDAGLLLKTGGTLFVETFTAGDDKYNPTFPAAYRLDPAQIPTLFKGLRTLLWEERDNGSSVRGTFIGAKE